LGSAHVGENIGRELGTDPEYRGCQKMLDLAKRGEQSYLFFSRHGESYECTNLCLLRGREASLPYPLWM